MEIDRHLRHCRQLLLKRLQPLHGLAGSDGIERDLLVEKYPAVRLAGGFAGRGRDEARKHPGLHSRHRGQGEAPFLQSFAEDHEILGGEKVLDRPAVGEHGQFRPGEDRGGGLPLVEDLVGFDDDNLRAGVSLGRPRWHPEDARVGDVHRAQKVGRWNARALDPPEKALAVHDGAALRHHDGMGLRIGALQFVQQVLPMAGGFGACRGMHGKHHQQRNQRQDVTGGEKPEGESGQPVQHALRQREQGVGRHVVLPGKPRGP